LRQRRRCSRSTPYAQARFRTRFRRCHRREVRQWETQGVAYKGAEVEIHPDAALDELMILLSGILATSDFDGAVILLDVFDISANPPSPAFTCCERRCRLGKRAQASGHYPGRLFEKLVAHGEFDDLWRAAIGERGPAWRPGFAAEPGEAEAGDNDHDARSAARARRGAG